MSTKDLGTVAFQIRIKRTSELDPALKGSLVYIELCGGEQKENKTSKKKKVLWQTPEIEVNQRRTASFPIYPTFLYTRQVVTGELDKLSSLDLVLKLKQGPISKKAKTIDALTFDILPFRNRRENINTVLFRTDDGPRITVTVLDVRASSPAEQGPEPPKYVPLPPPASGSAALPFSQPTSNRKSISRRKSVAALSSKDSNVLSNKDNNVFAGSAASDNLAGLITPNKSKDKSLEGKASARVKKLKRKLSLSRKVSRKEINNASESDNEVNEEEIPEQSNPFDSSFSAPVEPNPFSTSEEAEEKKTECSESEISEMEFGAAKCVTEQGSEEDADVPLSVQDKEKDIPKSPPKQTIGGNTDPTSKHLFSMESIVSDDIKFDLMYKVVIVGNSGVGKSSVMGRWTHNHFTVGLPSTIHVELSAKTFKCFDYVVKVQFWDTAGQERFNSITKNYYRGAHGAVIVYDITQRGTFEAIPRWLKELREANSDAQVLLIGNKDDVEQFREVPTDEAVAFARTHGVSFLETSALKGTNCAYAMQIILQDLHRAQQERALALAATSPPAVTRSRVSASTTIKLALDDNSASPKLDRIAEDISLNSENPSSGQCTC